MPSEYQLNIEKTFESQKDVVTQIIIPALMKTLDLITYLVGEGVIYKMLHRRHHHRRNNERNKKKEENERKRDVGRKHRNLRRLEVNINIIFYW